MSLAAIEEESVKISPLLSFATKGKKFKISFMIRGEVLIYVALSKDPYESLTSLRKQLEILHLQFIALTTNGIINTLKMNPSFDVVNEFGDFYHIIDSQVSKMVKDPFTFLN